LTTLATAVLRGAQRPRVLSVPPCVSSAGAEAVELAEFAGLVLDPWQRFVLEQGLGERPDGKWAAFEVGLIVPRQNGKGSILEALELAGLFLFGERLILHSAHEFKTAQEAFNRVLSLVEGNDWLRKKVARVRTSHGEEGIELLDGGRLRFVARSGGSGRGFSCDRLILDEAMILAAQAMAALLPTLSARPNPQVWYTGSAGLESSEQLRRVRARGMAGNDPSLAYFEWSAHEDSAPDDIDAQAMANPTLGHRVTLEMIARERAALPEVEFGREILGIWSDARREAVIDPVVWDRLADLKSDALDPVTFAFDVTPDRGMSAIASAGRRSDGRLHGEVIDYRPGTSWVVPRLAELVQKWQPNAILLDPAGPAGSLLPDLERAGVETTTVTSREMAQACGLVYDLATQDGLRHMGQSMLDTALLGAKQRPLGDAWAWARKGAADICPLYAFTLAVFGAANDSGEVNLW
jgi:phage terminase large subunit-like protein